jgi:uncharacterized damage-inducible protein DinB
VTQVFTAYAAGKLEQYAARIEDCLSRLTDEQIWLRGGRHDNAVGNIVLHLCGNIRQWIGFGVAGEPDLRERDAEFAARGGVPAAELKTRLRTAVDNAAAIVRAVTPAQLMEVTTIQTYTVTKLEAIFHVVEHFSGHTGQIIFATKLLTDQDLSYYGYLSGESEPNDLLP